MSGRPPASSRLAPADLAARPQVNALLGRLGLGELRAGELQSFLGRHDNWAGLTTSGVPVFVKHFGGDPAAGAVRLERVLAYERLPADRRSSPRCLGWSTADRLIAYHLHEAAEPGGELARAEEFTDALAHRAGVLVGRLHAAPVEAAPDREAPRHPSVQCLQGLPGELFDRSSAAELEAWRLMQQDPELGAAIESLCAQERVAARRPGHGDLRLDQFLLDRGELLLTDWDEFGRLDPARDVGAFAGEWLYRAVVGIWLARDDAVSVDPRLTHADIMRIGVAELTRLRPRIEAFGAGYRSQCPLPAELAARATAFAGWHLFDRMLAAAAQRTRLSGIDRAAAAIGRTALCNPAAFATVLGLRS